jgi:hypothetical protein
VRRIELALIGAERIARFGLLDLDDVRAEICEQHARSGASDERAHFEHRDVLERQRQSLSPSPALT